MNGFRELEEFERCFDTMNVVELKRWKAYWTLHAQQLAPKVRRLAMKRVHKIEEAIAQRGGDEPDASARPIPETSRDSNVSAPPTQKAKVRAGRIMYI